MTILNRPIKINPANAGALLGRKVMATRAQSIKFEAVCVDSRTHEGRATYGKPCEAQILEPLCFNEGCNEMMWKAKAKPKLGDTRTVKKFAWLPIKVCLNRNDSEPTHWIWMQKYKQWQIYQRWEEWAPDYSISGVDWCVLKIFLKY